MTDQVRLNGFRILVVEDEVLVAMLLEEMLQDLGCQVVGIESSVAGALAAVNLHVFDGAVLDINLKGERVEPVADALALRGVPFIFASGYGEPGLAERFATRPLLQKPYEMTSLAETLASALPGSGR